MKEITRNPDVMKGSRGMHGFNRRIFGETHNEAFGYPCAPDPAGEAGFELADGMILAGKIYYVNRFAHKWGNDICKGSAFPYGGTWVCNTCNNSNLGKPWWKVKVYKDGDAWCCVGEDFEDLQASSNFAFGDTRDEALKNYETLMLSPTPRTEGEV